MTNTLDPIVDPAPVSQRPGRMADTLLLRMNALPGRRLSSAELRAALREHLTATEAAARLRDAACDELFALAGTLTGPERSAVLTLKRAIYNDREPAEAAHDKQWSPAVTAWLAAWQRRRLAAAAIRNGYETYLAAERTLLAELIGAENFQLSLALTSPQVLDAVRRYRRRVDDLTARDRKSERGIIQHLMRAMLRTSPLTRFTAVAFGSWQPDGDPLDAPRFDPSAARSFLHVDRSLLSATVTGIVAPPGEAVPSVLIRNPTLRSNSTGARYQHRDASQVRLLSVPPTPQLAVLLNLTATGPLPAGVLAAEVALRLGIPAEEGERVVAAAVRSQLLVAAPVLDEQSDTLLTDARALLAVEHPELAAAAAAIGAELDLIRTGTVAARAAALDRLSGQGEARLNAASSRPSRLQVNEDYVLPPVTMSTAGYAGALTDLAQVAEFYGLFDRYHEVRALLTAAFVERFGAGGQANLADCAQDLARQVLRREAALTADTVAEYGPADGSLATLLRLREDAETVLTGRVREHQGPEAVEFDPGWLAEFAAGLPDRFRAPAVSYSLLVQAVGGELVVNDCYPGHGILAARFLAADRTLGGAAIDRLGQRVRSLYGADGQQLLEDRGLHGANINARAAVLAEHMTPQHWVGVRLVHEASTDRLHLLDRDGAPIQPLVLGMKWIELMPAPLRIAMWLVESGRVLVDPIEWAHRARADAEPTTAYPRLRAGRVTLQRARWYPGADFPAAPQPGQDAAYLMDINAWRSAHGVPEQVVAKTPLGRWPHDLTQAAGSYVQGRRREKPQYVDLASALMVRSLPRMVERRGSGYFEEALPAVRNGVHATEWAIELDRPAFGRFAIGGAS
ncbi:MAG TPA: lantibiotic dehydratase [Jatrophihabitans sp.]|nr:lantibiotic dehydratase [Jatrophihabitans sp.]